MRVLVTGLLCVAGVVGAQYLIEAVAPQLPTLARSLLVAPFYVAVGLTVRAAAERHRRERRDREIS